MVSLIFWSVMIIVTLTYVTLVMRADNHGEGGIMALITLLRRWTGARGRRTAVMLAALGLFGAALFFGDSMITPAISVLSAVEGLKVIDPDFKDFIVPITAVIIVGLFSVQSRGTAAVGRFFGPVMIVWFTAIGACGIYGIVDNPEILKALSPTYALAFMAGHFHIAFFALAAIVLSVTGAEALYADMGHFGRRAITFGWLGLVLPACTLSYFGQGALVLRDESTVAAPFFLLTPEWARIPMVLLATAATVIASQAVITGAFSVASQAARLGYLPRLRIEHTSASTIGQIYVPWINGALMVAVLILVFAFRSSAALAYAFGMAVTGTITITTTLFFYYARTRWGWPLWGVLLGGGALLLVDLMFFAANLTKLVHGAWLPLTIAVVAFTVMTTWQRGREIVTRAREKAEGPLREFVDGLVHRDPAAGPHPGHGGVPQPRQGHRAAGDARQRRAQPCACRARHHHVRRDGDGAAGARLRADDARRPRLRQRRNRPRGRAFRIHGTTRRSARAARCSTPRRPKAPSTSATRRTSCRSSTCAPATRRRWRRGATAVHRDIAHHRRRRRPLRPAARPDGDRRLPARAVTPPLSLRLTLQFAAQPRKITHRIMLYM